MLLNDRQIKELAKDYSMISPFVDHQVQEGVVSYGLSSFGYDIRIADEFLVFRYTEHQPLITPKAFNPEIVKRVKKKTGEALIIKPGQYVLGKSVEYFKMPEDVFGICLGKSTYARCGLIVNITPMEPCYSDDTEILTDEGWKFFYELTGSEKVLTLNEDFEAEYKPIERIQKYFYVGDMLLLNHRELDFLVTPEHKLFVGKYSYTGQKRDSIKWFTIEAEKIVGKYNFHLTREVRWKGDDSHLEDWQKDEWFLKFLGAYLGDGSSYIPKKNGKNSGYIIKLAVVTNQRKREVFREIVTKLSYLFNFKVQETQWGFSFYSKKLFSEVNKLGKKKEKYIPREYLNLPPKYLNNIWYGLLNSDGNLTTETYITSSKELADNVQELLFKIGCSAIIRKEIVEIKKGHSFEAFRIRKTKNTQHKIKPNQLLYVPYCGFVYDITAKDNHIIFVRRNGKPVWSGNCWEGYLTIELANPTQYSIAVYPNEGIAQIVFFKGERPMTTYADKKGKYQGQKDITLPMVK